MKGIRHIGSRDRHFTSSGTTFLGISSRMRSFLALKFLPYPREKYPLKLNKISTAFSTHSPHDNSFLRYKYPMLNEKVSRLSELNSLYTKSWHNHSGSSMKYHSSSNFVCNCLWQRQFSRVGRLFWGNASHFDNTKTSIWSRKLVRWVWFTLHADRLTLITISHFFFFYFIFSS